MSNIPYSLLFVFGFVIILVFLFILSLLHKIFFLKTDILKNSIQFLFFIIVWLSMVCEIEQLICLKVKGEVVIAEVLGFCARQQVTIRYTFQNKIYTQCVEWSRHQPRLGERYYITAYENEIQASLTHTYKVN